MPEGVLRCEYCATVWTWLDLFRGRFPPSRLYSQRAYDDPVYRTPVGTWIG